MDDALKAAGAVGGMGVAGILGVVAYAIYDDRRMAWLLLCGLLLCVVLALVIVAARSLNTMWTTRTNMLREQRNADLTGARTWALTKDMTGLRQADPWTAILAAMPPQDVVDGVGHPVDYDAGAHHGSE